MRRDVEIKVTGTGARGLGSVEESCNMVATWPTDSSVIYIVGGVLTGQQKLELKHGRGLKLGLSHKLPGFWGTDGEKGKSPNAMEHHIHSLIIHSQDNRQTYGKLKKRARSEGYFGVPSPVIGSQPSTAENPFVPHPGLLPLTISLKTQVLAYKAGLMNPTGPFPITVLSSLIRVMILPQIGAAKLVP
jgi:hypothetical protein